MLITCIVLCVRFMGTGAGQSVRRLFLSALSKDGQLDIAECDSLRTKASQLRRHDPLFAEQRGRRCLSPAWSVHPFHGCGSKVSGALARCLTGTFCTPRPELRFNKRLARGQSTWHAWQRVVGTHYRQV